MVCHVVITFKWAIVSKVSLAEILETISGSIRFFKLHSLFTLGVEPHQHN